MADVPGVGYIPDQQDQPMQPWQTPQGLSPEALSALFLVPHPNFYNSDSKNYLHIKDPQSGEFKVADPRSGLYNIKDPDLKHPVGWASIEPSAIRSGHVVIHNGGLHNWTDKAVGSDFKDPKLFSTGQMRDMIQALKRQFPGTTSVGIQAMPGKYWKDVNVGGGGNAPPGSKISDLW